MISDSLQKSQVRHSSGLKIKVVLLVCQNCFIFFFSIKVVFKMRQNCSLKSTLIFEVKSISCLEIKVRYQICQNSLFITTKVLSYFRKIYLILPHVLWCVRKHFLEMIMITYGTQQYKVSKSGG